MSMTVEGSDKESLLEAIDKWTHPLVLADNIGNYLPLFSTIANVVNIFEKFVLGILSDATRESAKKIRYFKYIDEKSLKLCVVLLVPIIGNVVFCFYNTFKSVREKSLESVSDETEQTEDCYVPLTLQEEEDLEGFLLNRVQEIFPDYTFAPVEEELKTLLIDEIQIEIDELQREESVIEEPALIIKKAVCPPVVMQVAIQVEEVVVESVSIPQREKSVKVEHHYLPAITPEDFYLPTSSESLR